jgi:deazaflavin-dependent oxidoreductase (nitroreductase family)
MSKPSTRRWFLWALNHTVNRLTTRMARAGIGPFSLVRHIGRRSGHAYETPVILAKVADGFIAELTYGDRVDWYRNVTAAGGCVVVQHGKEYRVSGLETVDPEQGRSAYPPPFRQILTAMGRKEFRLLRTIDSPTG